MELTSTNVETVFMECLFEEREVEESPVEVEGIMSKVKFHPERLEGHRDNVKAMLAELPDDFQPTGGGGTSFLNACNDKSGKQWTGEHHRMEQLFQLGIGLGLAKWCLPREAWPALYGGMPYVMVVEPQKGQVGMVSKKESE